MLSGWLTTGPSSEASLPVPIPITIFSPVPRVFSWSDLLPDSQRYRRRVFLLLVSQVPQKSLLVLLLLSSVLELDITSLTTFLGFRATFSYT